MSDTSYNENIFSDNFRGSLHFARFRWLAKRLDALQINYKSIVELGCYDGKTIEFLPHKPDNYQGLDANWENGLDIAYKKWASHPEYVFNECNTPEEFPENKQPYDLAICMETLEHVPPDMVEPYLAKLAEVTSGYIFISVPNEKGLVGLFKYLAKRFLVGSHEEYTAKELLHMTLGNLQHIERNEHKGFDYDLMITQVEKYFDLVETSGFPLRFTPKILNFGIGIIAKSKTT